MRIASWRFIRGLKFHSLGIIRLPKLGLGWQLCLDCLPLIVAETADVDPGTATLIISDELPEIPSIL